MLHDEMRPDDVLDALGNPERRRLIGMLAGGPRSVGDVAREFSISRPAISRHLKVLKDARLVRDKPSGTRNLYELEPEGFAVTARWLNSFWDEAEARLRLLAENTAGNRE